MEGIGIYDIVIVGLGPAGATLGRLLSAEFSVLALDKKNPEGGGFEKPCGGLLAPDAQKALARFGLTLPKAVLADPQIFAVETVDLPSGLRRTYIRDYINMDRHAFDMWLLSLLPPNVGVVSGAVFTGLAQTTDGYVVTYRKGVETLEARTKYVVGADGAASAVAACAGISPKARRYVAIQQWFHGENERPRYICAFDAALTDCYAWGLTKDGRFILGGAFPPKNCRGRFEQLKREIGINFGEPIKTEACIVLRPNGVTDCQTGKDGVFLVGEAAGFISPSSLEGISFALDSAAALGETLNAQKNVADYSRKTLKLRLKLFSKHIKQPFMYYPPLRRAVLKSGLTALR